MPVSCHRRCPSELQLAAASCSQLLGLLVSSLLVVLEPSSKVLVTGTAPESGGLMLQGQGVQQAVDSA